jgi:hypothetical protein
VPTPPPAATRSGVFVKYEQLKKKLQLPAGAVAPTRLVYGELEAQAITRDHLGDDVAGINASLDLIRQTRGGDWPTEPVTADGNFVDLVWHECEFRDAGSFTYAVYHVEHGYIGCCYLYPLGGRTTLTAELLGEYDVDVSWWVTPPAYGRGDYETLYAALQHWLTQQFAFWRPYFSNRELPGTDAGE